MGGDAQFRRGAKDDTKSICYRGYVVQNAVCEILEVDEQVSSFMKRIAGSIGLGGYISRNRVR